MISNEEKSCPDETNFLDYGLWLQAITNSLCKVILLELEKELYFCKQVYSPSCMHYDVNPFEKYFKNR